MFSIYDGRKDFYQWDLNRKLIVKDSNVKQVHFCNKTSDCSLVCETYTEDGVTLVNVPNILLQTNWRIFVYGYDADYTKHSDSFNVVSRSKPESYIYTETEVLSFNTLLERMNGIESNIADTVETYLEENPPEVNLDGYATTGYVDTEVKEAKDYADKAIANIPKTDLTNYATKGYVEEAISNIDIPEPADLTGYATQKYVNDAIGALPTYKSEAWVFTLEDGSTITKEVLLK